MAQQKRVGSGEAVDFGPENEKLRRNFLAMLGTTEGLLTSLSEDMHQDMVPVAIKAIAMELVKTSIELMEARDELAKLQIGMDAFGALASGFMGFEEYEPQEDEDPEGVEIKTMSRHIGFDIREGALA